MRDHEEALQQLSRFIDGDLPEDERRRVEQHAGRCEPCGSWLATYRLLADSLTGVAGDPGEEPSSETLATLAVAPETLDPPQRRRLEHHLEACRICREEVAGARRALEQARAEPVARFLPGRWSTAFRSVATPAVAAALVIAGLALVFFFSVARPDNREQHVADVDLGGAHLVEAEHLLLAERTTLLSGSTVVFRAGESVALGSGFVIGEGATLTVEISGPVAAAADLSRGH